MSKPILGEPVLKLPSVDSTNNYASVLLAKGEAKEGTVILADYQTHGKGHAGNVWFSETGKNLLCSIILQPKFLLAERQFFLSMCVSNALHQLVSGYAGSVRIKWPNDMLIDRKKVAGILIENTIIGRWLNTTVIGIGLNVNQESFPAHLANPVSIREITGNHHDIAEIFSGLLQALTLHVEKLYSEQYADIKTHYLNNLFGLNTWEVYTDASGTFEGRITDVADSGELMVVKRNGEVKFYGFKEIAYKT